MRHAFESGAGGVMLIEGTTDEALTSRSKDLYSRLKKEAKAFKLPIRYSHIETAQYEKLMNLLNVLYMGSERWVRQLTAVGTEGVA
ncbi:MAG: hypothetical protein KAT13_04870, partial [Methanosarcinales archaeon]|nr:hypothetical protein [Methanosarcinales archaeon]